MCIFGSGKSNDTANVKQTVPDPQPTAEAASIGDARKQEDNSLFGGTPDLRVNRASTSTQSPTGGAGLQLM